MFLLKCLVKRVIFREIQMSLCFDLTACFLGEVMEDLREQSYNAGHKNTHAEAFNEGLPRVTERWIVP